MSGFFIEDGYTANGHIAAVKDVHEAIDFEYRPMVQADRQAHYDMMVVKKYPADKALVKTVRRHLRGWSIPGDYSLENLSKLRSPILDKLYAIISGESASELRPGESRDEDELSPAEQEEADQKN